MHNILSGVLGTLYKMPAEEIADVLQTSEDGSVDEAAVLQLILEKDKDRTALLKAEASPKWDDAYKAAEKKVWGKVEKTLKDTLHIDAALKGDELVQHIATMQQQAEAAPRVITEDEVRQHAAYTQAETQWQQALADKEAEMQQALKQQQQAFTQKELFTQAKDAALLKFKTMGDAILPADAEKAQRLIDKLLVDELKAYQYQADDKGALQVLDANGNHVQNEAGHAIGFDALVQQIVRSNFEFKASQERRSPGNSNSSAASNGNAKYMGRPPATKEEYLGILTSGAYTTEQKLEVKKAWGEQFSKV